MSETYEHYCAPGNIAESGATCHHCGHFITSGEVIVDLPEHGDEVKAHLACCDEHEEDQREEAA